MVGIDVVRKDVFLKVDNQSHGDLSGVMGLSGSAVGSAVISMTTKLATRVVAKMFHIEESEVEKDDVVDAIGEFVNMISGGAKSALAGTKYHFQISLPTVVSGRGHELSHKKGTPCIVLLFQADDEEFVIEISVASTEDSGK